MKRLLLEGAVYALDNCGACSRRLRPAPPGLLRLRDHDDHVRPRGAGEVPHPPEGNRESGRRATLQPADLASKKGPLFSHIEKQEQAVLSIVQQADRDSPLGKLMRARMDNLPGSPEWVKADKELAAITEAQKKELPKQRHNRRMDALYVGLNDTQTGWVRPQDVTQDEAQQEVYHAVGDYNNALSRLEMDPPAGEAFLEAFHAWADRPQLSAVIESRV